MATRKSSPKAPPRFVDLPTVEAVERLIDEVRQIGAASEDEEVRLRSAALVAKLLAERDELREGVTRRVAPSSRQPLRVVPNR